MPAFRDCLCTPRIYDSHTHWFKVRNVPCYNGHAMNHGGRGDQGVSIRARAWDMQRRTSLPDRGIDG
jgi:hypothetical protein